MTKICFSATAIDRNERHIVQYVFCRTSWGLTKLNAEREGKVEGGGRGDAGYALR